jgi:hypothetical protein
MRKTSFEPSGLLKYRSSALNDPKSGEEKAHGCANAWYQYLI